MVKKKQTMIDSMVNMDMYKQKTELKVEQRSWFGALCTLFTILILGLYFGLTISQDLNEQLEWRINSFKSEDALDYKEKIVFPFEG